MKNYDTHRQRQLEAVYWTDYWLARTRKLAGIGGELRAELKQAAHYRIQKYVDKYEPEKGSSLSSWCYGHVNWAIKDAHRTMLQGFIGATEKGRGKTMPVGVIRIAGIGQQGDGDSTLDYPPKDAPGSKIDESIIDSDMEPLFDKQPRTQTAKELNDQIESGQAGAYDSDRNQGPVAERRHQREQRIHIFGEYRNEKERFVAFALEMGWTPEQAILFLSDPEQRAAFMKPVSVPNPKPEIETPWDEDFVLYRDRVKQDVSDITTYLPTASDQFSKKLKMFAVGCCSQVLEDETSKTHNEFSHDLFFNMVESGMSKQQMREAIATWLRLLPFAMAARNRAIGGQEPDNK